MNKFKTLGEIPYEDKKDIWANKMSGSQVKRVFTDLENLYKEKVGEKEPVNLNNIPGLAERLEMGNFMEPVIIKRAMEVHGLDIKIDKSTFESTNDEWFTANIDGYIGKDINNVEEIIEVKNTTVEDNAKLLDSYKYQIAYYMWFFNAKRAKLIALRNGFELVVINVDRNETFEKQMLEKLEEFKMNVDLGLAPSVQTESEIKENGKNVVISDEESLEKLNKETLESFEKLSEVNNQLSVLKKEKTSLEKVIKKDLEEYNKVEINYNGYIFQKNVINRKGSVDYNKLLAELGAKYDFDYLAEVEKFRKPQTKSISLKVKEVIYGD